MDRSYLSRRRIRPDQGNAPKVGACEFCYQKNVKIRPLECQNHFYCQVCEEFCPKIRNGDFTCRKCSQRKRMLDDENRKRVDDFYVKQEGLSKPKGFEEVIISIDGSNLISFDDDEEDLSGNNTEWDHLLQSLTNNDSGSKKESNSTKTKTHKNENEKRKRNKKHKNEVESDFPEIQVSSKSNLGGIDKSNSFTFLGQMGITGLSIKPEVENQSSTLEVAPGSAPNSPHQLLRDPEEPTILPADSDSLSERGTSPVKKPSKTLDAASWLGLRGPTKDDGTPGDPLIDIYEIEGPSFKGRDLSPTNNDVRSAFERDIIQGDDFWDF